MISGRLLSKENTYSFIDEPCKTCIFIHSVLLSTNICWKIQKFDFIIFQLKLMYFEVHMMHIEILYKETEYLSFEVVVLYIKKLSRDLMSNKMLVWSCTSPLFISCDHFSN